MPAPNPFEPFLARFQVDELSTAGAPPELPEWARDRVKHWHDLMDAYAGRTFESGMYRIHTRESSEQISRVIDRKVRAGKIVSRGEIFCFASEWFGSQFALQSWRDWDGEPAVLLLDLALDKSYEIDESFLTFHIHELSGDPNRALESNLFQAWAAQNKELLPLRPDQIVGYRIPLTLGGKHKLGNLMLTDLEVEFGINEQIAEQIHGMPEGTMILRVTGESR